MTPTLAECETVLAPSVGQACLSLTIQGYLAHKKTPTPPGPTWDPRHGRMVGAEGGVFSC